VAQVSQRAFFSYSRDDSEFAIRLAEDLKAAGANVWMDQLDIEPGMPWDRAIEVAVTNCPHMLVILSPTSVNSDNVRDEISFALSKQKKVIPVLYRECDVPFRLARLQHIDFRTDYGRGLKTLLKILIVEHQSVAARDADVPGVPRESLTEVSDADERKRATEETLRQAKRARLDQATLQQAESDRLEEKREHAERTRLQELEEARRNEAEQESPERKKHEETPSGSNIDLSYYSAQRIAEMANEAAKKARELEQEKQEQAERDRSEQEKLEQAKRARLKQFKQEQAERARLDQERLEQAERNRLEQEKQAKVERKRLEREKQAQARAEQERLENERIAGAEQERLEREKQAQAEEAERIAAQREQKRLKAEAAQREQERDRLEREKQARQRERLGRTGKNLTWLLGICVAIGGLYFYYFSGSKTTDQSSLTLSRTKEELSAVVELGGKDALWVDQIAWSPDNKHLATGSSTGTTIWDVTSAKIVLMVEGNPFSRVRVIAWSPSGARIVSADEYSTHVYDAATGKHLFQLSGCKPANSIVWSPNGRRIAGGCQDSTAVVWDSAESRKPLVLKDHTAEVNCVAWSPDGARVATGSSDRTIKLWDASTGKVLMTLSGHTDRVNSIVWSSDGNQLTSTSNDFSERVWETATGKILRTITWKAPPDVQIVRQMAWSPDGNFLVTEMEISSISVNPIIKVWDPKTDQALVTLSEHEAPSVMKWSSDGKYLAASTGNNVKVWRIQP
jgi:hypothetical protein